MGHPARTRTLQIASFAGDHHSHVDAAERFPRHSRRIAAPRLDRHRPYRLEDADRLSVASYCPLCRHCLRASINRNHIEGVSVPIFGVAKNMVDTFRHRSLGPNVAVFALKGRSGNPKRTSSENSGRAMSSHVWTTVRRSREAFTAND
jgi:hypothetical protein